MVQLALSTMSHVMRPDNEMRKRHTRQAKDATAATRAPTGGKDLDQSIELDLPLRGLQVVDLAGDIGAYCARLLGDLGADVLLIEPPTGHTMRRRPPFKDGVVGPEASL